MDNELSPPREWHACNHELGSEPVNDDSAGVFVSAVVPTANDCNGDVDVVK